MLKVKLVLVNIRFRLDISMPVMVTNPGIGFGAWHGWSLWTNWRWTNFLLSYQLPLRSKGRPGYRRNLKFIYMGLCEPRVAKSLVDLLCSSHFPKEMPRVNFWVACVVSMTLLHRLLFPIASPRVIRWMDGVALLSPLLGPIYIYIYIGAFSLLPLTSLTISFLPTRSRASSSFFPSFQVFPLPS